MLAVHVEQIMEEAQTSQSWMNIIHRLEATLGELSV